MIGLKRSNVSLPLREVPNWSCKAMRASLKRPPAVIEKAFERVQPAILIGCSQRDRADRHRIAGLSQEYPAAADNEAGAHGPELGASVVPCRAVVEARADDETIGVSEQLVAVGRLQRCAGGGRPCLRSVELTQHRIRRKRIGKLGAVQTVGRRNVIAKA